MRYTLAYTLTLRYCRLDPIIGGKSISNHFNFIFFVICFRTFTIVLIDANNQVNYYEWTKEHVNDTSINHDLDQHFQFNLA